MALCCDFWSFSIYHDLTILYTVKKLLIIAAILLITTSPVEAQCAMCRAVLESGEGQEIAKSVNSGIKYLMLFPYVLIGGLGYFIYRKYRHS